MRAFFATCDAPICVRGKQYAHEACLIRVCCVWQDLSQRSASRGVVLLLERDGGKHQALHRNRGASADAHNGTKLIFKVTSCVDSSGEGLGQQTQGALDAPAGLAAAATTLCRTLTFRRAPSTFLAVVCSVLKQVARVRSSALNGVRAQGCFRPGPCSVRTTPGQFSGVTTSVCCEYVTAAPGCTGG